MIILDTNIISELMKSSPAISVIRWVDQQDASLLFVTAITIAEISYSIGALPHGNRRRLLENAFEKVIKEAFKHRLLFFDETAAYIYGKIMSHRKSIGRPLSILDGQIASITVAQKAILATRNSGNFSDCDVELIDPFST